MTYTLHMGDCLEYMQAMPDGCVDAVITDPPYGIERFSKGFGYTRFKGYGAEQAGLTWDIRPTDDVISLMLNIGWVHVVWGANNFTLPPSQCFLVWDKMQTVDNFASAELAYCDKKNLTAKVFRYPIHKHNQTIRQHPTQKPVDLMIWCLELVTLPGDTVFDPFMGSGTTGVACMQLGRNFIGCEIDPGYFDIAKRRIEQAAAQPPLFTLDTPKTEQLSLLEAS